MEASVTVTEQGLPFLGDQMFQDEDRILLVLGALLEETIILELKCYQGGSNLNCEARVATVVELNPVVLEIFSLVVVGLTQVEYEILPIFSTLNGVDLHERPTVGISPTLPQ